ncbi:MAG: response regulator, partial [Myxococcales bacterium]|nr:response regulator [Myxococcales bacterium]
MRIAWIGNLEALPASLSNYPDLLMGLQCEGLEAQVDAVLVDGDLRAQPDFSLAQLRTKFPNSAFVFHTQPGEELSREELLFSGFDESVDFNHSHSPDTLQVLRRVVGRRRLRRDGWTTGTEKYVLVVDDEPMVKETITNILRRSGYNVHCAESVVAGLGILHQHPIHVIISDLRMPKHTGIDLVRAARNFDPTVAPVIITGFPEVDSAMQALRLGAVDFLTKPLRAEELRAVVDRSWTEWALGQGAIGRTTRSCREALSLLIVESDPGVAEVLQDMIVKGGAPNWQTAVSASLSEALILLESVRFDAVVLDVQLPDATGLNAFVRLNPFVRNAAVVAIGTDLDPSTVANLRLTGAEDY